MNVTLRLTGMTAAALLLAGPLTGCNQLKARDQINKGVQAYKGGHMEEAIDHFQTAEQLDPNFKNAKLYLATAYASQVTPNLTTPENLTLANKAIDLYQQILQDNPRDTRSLKGIASIYFNINQQDKAKDYQEKVVSINPNDPEAWYTIGVIDWKAAYNNAIVLRNTLGQTDDGSPIKDKNACTQLQAKNGPLVQEGLDALQKAVNLRTNYSDAMAYLNLMYRRKAELECGDDAARKADVALADEWVHKAMDAKKAEDEEKEKKAAGGIVIQQDK